MDLKALLLIFSLYFAVLLVQLNGIPTRKFKPDEDTLDIGSDFFEEDIKLPKNDPFAKGAEIERAENQKPIHLWPLGKVFYKINENEFEPSDIELIREAMNSISSQTCILFIELEDSDGDDYIIIQNKEKNCWSFVGHRRGGQPVNLESPKCIRKGFIIHELLHALGLYHEKINLDDTIMSEHHGENVAQKESMSSGDAEKIDRLYEQECRMKKKIQEE